MTQTLRVGCIGVGTHGAGHARSVRSDDRASVVALADPNAANLAQSGAEVGVPPRMRFREYRSLLEDADPDAVIIATPPALHHEQVLAALDHDCHVFCEKPLAVTTDEVREMLERDRASDRTVMVGFQRHLNPALQEARSRWTSDGPAITTVVAHRSQDWSNRLESTDDWRVDPEISGGGHLFNVGMHLVDAILWATGLTPVSVVAEMSFIDAREQIDAQGGMVVTCRNGPEVTVATTGRAHGNEEHLRVWDDEGQVLVDLAATDPTLRVTSDTDTVSSPSFDAPRDPIVAFIDAIESGTTPPATTADGLRATMLVSAAYESARSGTRITIDEWPRQE